MTSLLQWKDKSTTLLTAQSYEDYAKGFYAFLRHFWWRVDLKLHRLLDGITRSAEERKSAFKGPTYPIFVVVEALIRVIVAWLEM